MRSTVFLAGGALAVLLAAGCGTYPPLPPQPEYPPLSGSYDTTAPLYLRPWPENRVNALIREAFRRNGYGGLQGDLPERLVDRSRAKVVMPVEFSQETVDYAEGKHLLTCIVVVVRKTGGIVDGRMWIPAGKTFRAESCCPLPSDGDEKDIRIREAAIAVERLFRIEGFRKALE